MNGFIRSLLTVFECKLICRIEGVMEVPKKFTFIQKTATEVNCEFCFWLWALPVVGRMGCALWLFCFSFWLQNVFSGEVPTGVVKWLETSGRYTDMECKARKVDGLPSTNSTTDLDMRVIFESGDYWERSLIRSVDFKAKLERSYVNGIQRAFQHWNETEKQGRLTPEQQGTYGFIETVSWDDRRDSEFLGMSLGYRFGRSFGVWKNLSDFAKNGECEVQKSDSLEEVLLFKDVGDFGPSNKTHYDIRATLAKRYQHLATKLEGIERIRGEPDKLTWVHSFEDFKQVDERWIPTKIFSGVQEGFGRLVTIDVETVKLNTGLSSSDIELKFLKGQRYFDSFEKQMYRDGIPIQSSSQAKAIPSPRTPASRTAVIVVAVAGGILIILGILLRKRRTAIILLASISLAANSTGCNKTTALEKANDIREFVEVIPGGRQSLSARIDSKRVSTTFKLVNRSKEEVILESYVSATCGCTNAELSKTTLAPNEECEVMAEVNIPNHAGRKMIELTVMQKSPKIDEIRLIIDANFEGDWGAESDMLKFSGNSGQSAQAVIKLFGSKKELEQVKLVDFEPWLSIETDNHTEGGREIVLSRKLGVEVQDSVLVDIKLVAPGLVPSEFVIRASESIAAPGKWTPRAISLTMGQPKTSDLKLEPGFKLVSIEPNELIDMVQVQDKSNSVVSAKFTLCEDAAQARPDKGVVQINAIVDVEGNELKLPLYVLIEKE